MEHNSSKINRPKRPDIRPQIPDNQTGGIESTKEIFIKKSQKIIVEILKNNKTGDGRTLLADFLVNEHFDDVDLNLSEKIKLPKNQSIFSVQFDSDEKVEKALNSEISFLGKNYIEMLYEDFKKTGHIEVENFPFMQSPDLFFIKYSTILTRTEKYKQTQFYFKNYGEDAIDIVKYWKEVGQEIINKLTEYWSSL